MRITSRNHIRRQQLHVGVPKDLYKVLQIVAIVKMVLRCGLSCGRILVPANGGAELYLRRRISIRASRVRNMHTHNTAIRYTYKY